MPPPGVHGNDSSSDDDSDTTPPPPPVKSYIPKSTKVNAPTGRGLYSISKTNYKPYTIDSITDAIEMLDLLTGSGSMEQPTPMDHDVNGGSDDDTSEFQHSSGNYYSLKSPLSTSSKYTTPVGLKSAQSRLQSALDNAKKPVPILIRSALPQARSTLTIAKSFVNQLNGLKQNIQSNQYDDDQLESYKKQIASIDRSMTALGLVH